ncbi:hypothetical protein [Actinomadura violacea]|uniref:Secreted protein n=1 Tax=Actinomadura violacea TaxID=2819934 RepID=A0ABS3SAH2_9ACTN|nr:hypothetical protein [Actinomadura violacea]MBO2465189.1 hypothetical protein [Actinomadura violacea]
MKVGKMAKRLMSLAAAGVAVTSTLLFASAPEASAVTWKYTMHTDDGDPGGKIQFQPNGDWVRVCDIESDGWKVWGSVGVSKGTGDLDVLWRGGNGNCMTHHYNLPEKKLYFEVCLQHYESGPLQYCDTSVWLNHNS